MVYPFQNKNPLAEKHKGINVQNVYKFIVWRFRCLCLSLCSQKFSSAGFSPVTLHSCLNELFSRTTIITQQRASTLWTSWFSLRTTKPCVLHNVLTHSWVSSLFQIEQRKQSVFLYCMNMCVQSFCTSGGQYPNFVALLYIVGLQWQ